MVTSNHRVEVSDKINNIESVFKTKALQLLEMFDIEQSPGLTKVKHYPLDSLVINEKDIELQLKLSSNALWMTLASKLQEILPLVKEVEVGCRWKATKGKIGKVLYASPNTFAYANTEQPFKLFAFVYKTEQGEYEVQSEINFTVQPY